MDSDTQAISLSALSFSGCAPTASGLTTQEVYRLHARRVALWAAHLGGPSVDVEETTQEVFVVVHQRLPGFVGKEALVPWLWRITENVVRQQLRAASRRHSPSGNPEEVAGGVATLVPGPLEDLEGAEARALVYLVLDRLKPTHRTVLILYELEAMTAKEIAELKGVSLSTVWVWLHRARREFARRFAEWEQGLPYPQGPRK